MYVCTVEPTLECVCTSICVYVYIHTCMYDRRTGDTRKSNVCFFPLILVRECSKDKDRPWLVRVRVRVRVCVCVRVCLFAYPHIRNHVTA